MVQNFVVALLVAGCFGYALWTLAPKAPRSRLAAALLKLPLPSFMQRPLSAAAKQQGGCACDGCDRSTTAKKPAAPGSAGPQGRPEFQTITFVRGNYAKKTPL